MWEIQTIDFIASTDIESTVLTLILKKMTYKVKKGTEADIEITIKAVDLNIYLEEYIQFLILNEVTEDEIEENAIIFLKKISY